MTPGVGLKFGPGSRHWLNQVTEGDVGIFLPGDEQDAFYARFALPDGDTHGGTTGEEAAREGFTLGRSLLSRTGLHSTPICFARWPGSGAKLPKYTIPEPSPPIGSRRSAARCCAW